MKSSQSLKILQLINNSSKNRIAKQAGPRSATVIESLSGGAAGPPRPAGARGGPTTVARAQTLRGPRTGAATTGTSTNAAAAGPDSTAAGVSRRRLVRILSRRQRRWRWFLEPRRAVAVAVSQSAVGDPERRLGIP